MADYVGVDMCKHTRLVFPSSGKGGYCGPKGSAARLMGMIDRDDPSFAAVVAALGEMSAAGVDIDEVAISIALKLGKLRHNDVPVPSYVSEGLPSWDGLKSSIVYYILRGPLIKIGTTTQPKQRFEDLMPDQILAFEPGGREIEVHRHRQFQDLREGCEYFRRGPDLAQHIKRMRREHGDPDPSWRTTANIADAPKGALGNKRPSPVSLETATIKDAARVLGIKRTTIYSWVQRGKLQAAIEGADGPLFFLDHIRDLKGRSRAYRDTPGGKVDLPD